MTVKQSTSKRPLNVGKFYDITDLTANTTVVFEKGNYTGIVDKGTNLEGVTGTIDHVKVDAQDLTFDVTSAVGGGTLSVRVKDYFAKDGKVNIGFAGSNSLTSPSGSYLSGTLSPDDILNNNLYNSYTLKSDYEKEPKVIKGTAFADQYDFRNSAKAVTINAAGGNDTIVVSKGNDTITAGLGANTVSFYATDDVKSLGDNVVKLTKGEGLTLDGHSAVTGEGNVVYTAKIEGKDVVVTGYSSANTTYEEADHKVASFKLEGAAKKDILGTGKDVTFGADSLKTYEFEGLEAKRDTYTGGYLSEKVNNGVSKNETYKLGLGNNVVVTDLSDATKDYGTDKINLTKGENLQLRFTGDIANQVVSRVAENKKDVEVVAYKNEDVDKYTKVTTTVTDVSAQDVTKKVILKGDNTLLAGFGLDAGKFYDVTYTHGATDWNVLTAGDCVENGGATAEVTNPVYKVGTATLTDADVTALFGTDGKLKAHTIFKTSVATLNGTYNTDKYVVAAAEGSPAVSFALAGTAGESTAITINGSTTALSAGTLYTALDALTVGDNVTAKKSGVGTNVQATFTIVGAATKDLGGLVTINGINNNDWNVIGNVTNVLGLPSKGNKLTGLAVTDIVNLTDAPIDSKIKGYVINTGLGDDVIAGSKGNDTISAGKALAGNTINYDLEAGAFGDDVINVVKGEKTGITFGGDISGQVRLTHNGKDAIFTAYDSTKAAYGVKIKITTAGAASYDAETNKTTFDKTKIQTATLGEGNVYGDLAAPEANLVLDGDLTSDELILNSVWYVEYQKNGETTVGTFVVDDFNANNIGHTTANSTVIEDKVLGTVTVKGIAAKDNHDKGQGGIFVDCDNVNNPNGLLDPDGWFPTAKFEINLAAKDAKGKDLYIKGDKAAFKGTYVDENITLAQDAKKTTLSFGGGKDVVKLDPTQSIGEVTATLAKGNDVTLNHGALALGADVSYKYEIVGKDVVATMLYDNDTLDATAAVEKGKIIYKNYAAKDPGAVVKDSKAQNISTVLYDAVADKKGNYTKGTWLNETAAAKDDVAYKLGTGNNKITYDATSATTFNDKGATVTLTKGEVLDIDQTNGLGGNKEVTYTYGSDGKDATVTAWYDNDKTDATAPNPVGKFTFKGLAAKDLGADVTIDTATDVLAQDFVLAGKDIKNKGKAYNGTWLNDVALATEKDDTFKLGANVEDGHNVIKMSAKGAIGADTVTLTKGENLLVEVDANSPVLKTKDQLIYTKVGNDIVATLAGTSAIASYSKVEFAKNAYAITDNTLKETEVFMDGVTKKVHDRTFNNTTHKWGAWENETASDAEIGSTFKATVNDAADTAVTADAVAAYLGEANDEGVYTEGAISKYVGTKTTYAWNEGTKKYTTDGGAADATIYSRAATMKTNHYSTLAGEGAEPQLLADMTPGEFATLTADVAQEAQHTQKDLSKDALGTITFKNYAKDMENATITVQNSKEAAVLAGDTVRLDNAIINIATTGGTAQGTIANDKFIVTAKAKKGAAEAAFTVKDGVVTGVKNTFVETYTKANGIDANDIYSVQGAKDMIQVSAGKGADKLSAKDFAYTYADNSLQINTGKGTVSYYAQQVDENGKRVVDELKKPVYVDNLENVQLKDTTNGVYQFGRTVGETDADLAVAFGAKDKNNHIHFVQQTVALTGEHKVTVADSAKNDIIYGVNYKTDWTYTAGNDKYIAGTAVDTYDVTFGKKTNVLIKDAGGADVLKLTAEKNKSLASSDLMLFFDVKKAGAGTYKVGGDSKDLIIMQKDAFTKGTALANAINNDKWAGGSVVIDDYFNAAAQVTGVVVANDHTVTAGYTDGAGAGRVETINVGTTEYTVGTDITKVAQEVSAWLANHGNYDSASQVIAAGNKNDIQSLLNVYQGATYLG